MRIIFLLYFIYNLIFGTPGFGVMALLSTALILYWFIHSFNVRSSDISIGFVLAAFVLCLLPGVLLGLLRGNAGAYVLSTFFLISIPLHFLMFKIGRSQWVGNIIFTTYYLYIINVLVGSSILIFFYIYGNEIFESISFLFFLLDRGFGFGVDDGFEIQFPNYALFIFVPAFFNSYYILRFVSRYKTPSVAGWFMLFGINMFTFLIGSRSIFVSTVSSVALMFILAYFSGIGSFFKRSRFLILLTIFFVSASIVFGYIQYNFIRGISSGVVSDTVRLEQFNYLIDNIANNPFFGNGIGHVGEFVRSLKNPWAFELSYFVLAQWIGLPFFFLLCLLLAFCFIFSFINLKLVSLDELIIYFSSLAGSLSMLIASIFNPYIFNFGSLWVVFLPFWVNYWYSTPKAIPFSYGTVSRNRFF